MMATDLTTADLPESDRLYEEIDGRLVEALPMSFFANLIAGAFYFHLETFAKPNDLGFAVIEGLFHFGPPVNRNRRPDLAFVSRSRWPKEKSFPRTGDALDVTPDLMGEVISPTNLMDEVMTKLDEYFRAGAVQVWLVFPNHSKMQIFDSPTSSRWLTRDDVLDNIPFLPGFQLSLREIFVEPA